MEALLTIATFILVAWTVLLVFSCIVLAKHREWESSGWALIMLILVAALLIKVTTMQA